MIDNFKADIFFTDNDNQATYINLVHKNDYADFVQALNDTQKNYLEKNAFDIERDSYYILPNISDNNLDYAFIMAFDGIDYHDILNKIDKLPKPIKSIAFKSYNQAFDIDKMAYLWGAHFYKFDFYKKSTKKTPQLYYSQISDKVQSQLRALFLGRNAVNLPAEDLTPLVLQQTLESFATEFQAECTTIIGSELLEHKLNLIHAVGRSITDAERQPRLIDFYYKSPNHNNAKTITLVGKGVCFDTGGLNIKTGNSMSLMKKDMGGAATVLAVTLNLLLQKPNFNLRVLIPTVENNVAGNSFRPSDIFTAYNGKTVEITNTDAEGRLILADALSYAAEKNPDLLIDIATLTGAARVAVGPDMPVLCTNNNDLVAPFMESECYNDDPIWQLPLWQPYASKLKGTISDLINAPSGGMAGSITAALFLQNFIGDTKNWIHFDSYCHVPTAKPAHPKGGDVMPFTLLSDVIQKFCS
ncbi:MAG: leucyl aminopeptidase [Dasania sp.]|jgi:leucyl aminopeptidase